MTAPFRCRSCGSADTRRVLSLGRMPLANALPAEPVATTAEPTYPLELAFCPTCALVQITESVPPDALFRDYLYFSSFSDTMLAHAKELTDRLVHDRHLDAGSLAMEIASNDGYLLQYYKQRGVPVLGIEPARNIARVAVEERGIPTLSEFFDRALAERLVQEHKRADVLHANNVLAHVPDLSGFVAGIRAVLKDPGIAVIEVPYVREMIDRVEFDTIYHEHLSYFSVTAVERLFANNDLRLVDVERLAIHGGSLRLTAARPDGGSIRSRRVDDLLRDEEAAGMTQLAYYADFAARVAKLKEEVCSTLAKLKAEGKRIAAYGAAAKGSTLLNFFGIGRETLDYVVDRSPHKQGRYLPGVRVPILPPSKLLEDAPDYTLLLAWNFADEILEQQKAYRAKGGRFLIPVPHVRVV